MQARAAAMYAHDPQGRITAVNQWDGGLVPRFHLFVTAAGALWRFRRDVPQSLADSIACYAASERLSAQTPAHDARYRALLAAHAPIERLRCGPAFVFPEDFASDAVATPIDESNAHLLKGGLEPWRPDVPHRRPFMASLEDGRAAAVCVSARIGAAAHEAGVETDPAYRRRGHAVRAVAAWGKAVQALGLAAYYSTTWDNLASQAVAARLGLVRIGTDYSIV